MADAEQRSYGNVPPVLTRAQWADIEFDRQNEELAVLAARVRDVLLAGESEAAAAAICIAELPSDDRRKFGWDYVDKLREIAKRLNELVDYGGVIEDMLHHTANAAALTALADILASYLPPRLETATTTPNAGGSDG